jgi:lyso-ornithine lipid O-acyltransferase
LNPRVERPRPAVHLWDVKGTRPPRKAAAPVLPDPSAARAAFRLLRFLSITVQELLRCAVLARRDAPRHQAAAARNLQRWAVRLVDAMGVRIRLRGEPPPPGVLLVANHRSYMDITVIAAGTACSFLAKSEIARWPLLGTGARRFANVVFVRRDSPASRRQARLAVAKVLHHGGSITVFPEGTTTAGPGLLPFRKGIFEVAAEGRFRVVPVAVAYDDPRDAWVGEETFLGHFLKTFSKTETRVTVSFGPCLQSADADSLKRSAWEWIHRRLSHAGPAAEGVLPRAA